MFAPKIDGITNRLDHTVRHLTGKGHDRRLVLQYRKTQVLAANRGFVGRVLHALL